MGCARSISIFMNSCLKSTEKDFYPIPEILSYYFVSMLLCHLSAL